MLPVPLRERTLHELFVDHYGWLLTLLRRRMDHSGEAEDLTADTFCEVVASRLDPAEIREPRAFLRRIAQRLLYRRYRLRALENEYLERMMALPPAFAPSPEERMLVLEAVQQLDQALDGLPRAVRAVFVYSQIEGLSYPQIGDRMGLSQRTVARHMARALERFALLDPAYGNQRQGILATP